VSEATELEEDMDMTGSESTDEDDSISISEDESITDDEDESVADEDAYRGDWITRGLMFGMFPTKEWMDFQVSRGTKIHITPLGLCL
jgi:hypothetical protein